MDWLIGSTDETSSLGVAMIRSLIENELLDVNGLGGVSGSLTSSKSFGVEMYDSVGGVIFIVDGKRSIDIVEW